ncbi:MAG: hypothetical protein JXB42_10420 [Deltaproteobacteria bacterium]|nr:hypothetical protein [Deltaproteobacteria bacterium]
MPKYTVYFLTPHSLWEGIEAEDEDDAIRQCKTPPEFDGNEPSEWVAIEE